MVERETYIFAKYQHRSFYAPPTKECVRAARRGCGAARGAMCARDLRSAQRRVWPLLSFPAMTPAIRHPPALLTRPFTARAPPPHAPLLASASPG